MASQGGVSKLGGNTILPPVQPQRNVDQAQASQAAGRPGDGAGRREAPESGRRPVINFDGKTLNRTAPRGTYLNILV
jgi:hypothetical protein